MIVTNSCTACRGILWKTWTVTYARRITLESWWWIKQENIASRTTWKSLTVCAWTLMDISLRATGRPPFTSSTITGTCFASWEWKQETSFPFLLTRRTICTLGLIPQMLSVCIRFPLKRCLGNENIRKEGNQFLLLSPLLNTVFKERLISSNDQRGECLLVDIYIINCLCLW